MSSPKKSYLYDPNIFEKLSDWKEIKSKLDEHKLIARPLCSDDHSNGYLKLLEQLTVVGNVSESLFRKRFHEMKEVNDKHMHYIIVIFEDSDSGRIIAASTLLFEFKFIHECALRGRLEDVVVCDSYRGKKLGILIVKIIVGLAEQVYRCYKLSLDCKEGLVPFYKHNRFTERVNMLSVRFD